MRNRLIYLIAPLLVICLAFLPQRDQGSLTIRCKYNLFTVDNLGNIYTARDEELIKYLPTGKTFARYSNLKLGNISVLDATNPLKLLVYYRDFQTLVFLDNQLTANSDVVALQDLGYEQTDLVCAGANNSFWIYNKQNNELVKFTVTSKVIASTGNLKQILQRDISPNYMLEHNNYLYLNCPETGIYVFDIFGAFSKIIAIKGLKQFQVNENIIYYQKDSAFCSYDHKLFEEACTKGRSDLTVNGVRFINEKMYRGYKDSILVTSFR